LDYVHLNPVRAGLTDARKGQSVLDYVWSSVAGGHALALNRRPRWLATEHALSAFGFEDTTAGRRRWVKRLDDRADAEAMEKCGIPAPPEDGDAHRSDLRRGWYWGSQAFAEKLLKIGETALRQTRSRSANASREKQAHREQEAKRLVAEGMAMAGLTHEDLKKLPGSEPRKVAVARVVWDRTTVGMPWLAEQLNLRSAANASQQIRRHRRQPPALARKLQKWIIQSINAA
jgi:hypothetical protein